MRGNKVLLVIDQIVLISVENLDKISTNIDNIFMHV